MITYNKYVIIFTLFASLSCYGIVCKEEKYCTSYWLWAGITSKDVPPNSELYIYQGLITNDLVYGTVYRRIGLYPHPIKSKRLYLVYRLEGGLPKAHEVVAIFQETRAKWLVHFVISNGLQLDFDSPTSKLLIYSDFLKEVRRELPKSYSLSITGLGDWSIHGNKKVMQSIDMVTDEIVFQLYQGWYPLPDIESYIQTLKRYQLPFRIGLLSRYKNNNYIALLKQNVNFKGVIYFIQKDYEAKSFPMY